MRSITFAASFFFLFGALSLPTARSEPPAACGLLPEDAVVVLHVGDPAELIDFFSDSRMIGALAGIPEVKAGLEKQELKELELLLDYLELQLETDRISGAKAVLGGGITLAILPEEKVVMVVESSDRSLLTKLADLLYQVVRNEAEKEGEADRVTSAEYRGIRGWSFGKNQSHAVVENRLIVTNRSAMLRTMVDRLLDQDSSQNFTTTKTWRSIEPHLPENADAWVYVNMAVVNSLPQVQKTLSPPKDPWTSLLIGQMAEQLRDATWMLATLDVEGEQIGLQLTTDGRLDPDTPMARFIKADSSSEGALPNLNISDQIAGMSFYRDLHAFYGAKDDLFPERTSSLIFFENMMGIFFSGRDLTDEVFAELTPEIRVVVARQPYDPEATPQMQLPGFAAVFRMREPERFSMVVEEAWQKAIGLVNFTSGQQANPGLIIDRPEFEGVKYTVARYAPPANGTDEKVEVRHNFSPSLAMLHDYVILASSESVVEDLIAALKEEKSAPLDFDNKNQNRLMFDATALSTILDANRQALIRQNMLEEGHSLEEAEKAIQTLIEIVRLLGRLEVCGGNRTETMHLDASLRLNLPE